MKKKLFRLRSNEFLILIDHYERLANQLETLAANREDPRKKELLDLAGVYQTRATEIRTQHEK